jgi:hypothetical protein
VRVVDVVRVLFGGLEAEECHSKNVIRCGPLLDGACFGFLHWCSTYIQRIYFVSPLFTAYVRLVQRRIINNNIFTIKKIIALLDNTLPFLSYILLY